MHFQHKIKSINVTPVRHTTNFHHIHDVFGLVMKHAHGCCPCRKPRQAYDQDDDPYQAYATADTRATLAVSSLEAASWQTARPMYDRRWPECKGVCVDGFCALEWDHPACCYIDRGDDDEPWYASMVSVDGAHTSGYWASKDWYCWE